MLTGNRRQGVGYRDFSIFSSGCKQPNLSTVFPFVPAKVQPFFHSTKQ